MPEGWNEVTVGDLATVFDGPHATPAKTAEGPWYLSISSLVDGRLDLRASSHLSVEDFPRWTRRVRPIAGDTLFSYETRLGAAAHWALDVPAALGRRMGILRPRDGVDPRFLTYVYLGPRFQVEVQRRAIRGATVDRIPIAELASWPIQIPGIGEQRRISGVLGALDDLIEQEIDTAERLDSLSRALGARFIGSLQGSPRAPLSDLAEVSKGYSYRSSELVPSDTLLVNLKNMGRGGVFQPRGFKAIAGTPRPHQYVENGDVLVAQTDLTQQREVVGRPVRVRRGLVSQKLVASLDLVIVRPKPGVTAEYLFAVLDSPAFRAHALAHCNGTTVVHMASAAVPTFKAAVPEEAEVDHFSQTVAPLRAAADDAIARAERLRATRDELHPLLLTGRLSAREVAV